MPITNLSFKNVGPFDEIEFEFDPHVNVFTGPNNSGKSSALWVLGDIAVYPFEFPRKLLRPGRTATFKAHIQGFSDEGFVGELPCTMVSEDDSDDVNEYWNKQRSVEHAGILKMLGYSKFIPALRRSSDFRSKGPRTNQAKNEEDDTPFDSPDVESSRENHFDYHDSGGDVCLGAKELSTDLKKRRTLFSQDAILVSDEAVIQKIVELDYRSYLRRQSGFRDIIIKIGEVASEITDGFPIAFIGVNEDNSGFFPEFGTVDGPMPLNTLSQGTQSMIQWLAHFLIDFAEYYDFPADLEEKPGILVVDEIDAHLHPSWQRRILPTLTRNFPNLQIFCSTHSPMMLAGLRAGQVQLLRRDEKGSVTASTNESDVIGWTADEILRNFLEVPNPTDVTTAENTRRLQELRRKGELNTEEAEELQELRRIVSSELLSGPMSSQVEQFAEELKRARGESTS